MCIRDRANAVFTSQTQYSESNDHIEEFDADICTDCINQFGARNMLSPCVGDCTAEVHRIDEKTNGTGTIKIHGMSLENCVQCRTCEIVCPAENLRVNAALEGGGPNFLGL